MHYSPYHWVTVFKICLVLYALQMVIGFSTKIINIFDSRCFTGNEVIGYVVYWYFQLQFLSQLLQQKVCATCKFITGHYCTVIILLFLCMYKSFNRLCVRNKSHFPSMNRLKCVIICNTLCSLFKSKFW